MNIPYFISQLLKLLALGAIIYIAYLVPNPWVAAISVFIIGTLIASEAFILMIARSFFKQPTDENIVKLFIPLLFRDKAQADKILADYAREKELRYGQGNSKD
ncbi:MAG: hypothetical protein A3E36_02330 [Candidatus Andersenbacteria bacterium RIFCSPHIGHO2_12_FULL_45_11b]|uniref:Uncharacterized protein n=1 Tax=Candidatus Andersenbacteria bacterium RIFCSPHIGHO2_12_FULL_45_11b TaxID=1797282 RepID=A0A1G1XET1_9BACT|nr:MAG: hypothetical protein A3E36_02330 [Candidatus Andersenbacteria bacterium RIFCSPHIGHO2_12_FULL_45_11b]